MEDSFEIHNRIIFFNIGNDFTLSAFQTAYYIPRPYLSPENNNTKEVYISGCTPKQIYGITPIPSLKEYNNHFKTILENSYGQLIPCAFWKSKIASFIIRKSVTFVSLALPEEQSDIQIFYPNWLLLEKNKWRKMFQEYAELFPSLLRKIKLQCPNTVIAIYPMRSQTIQNDYIKVESALLNSGFAKEDINKYSFNEYIKTICNEISMQFIDTTKAFTFGDTNEKYYIPKNDHLSDLGLQLVGEYTVDALE